MAKKQDNEKKGKKGNKGKKVAIAIAIKILVPILIIVLIGSVLFAIFDALVNLLKNLVGEFLKFLNDPGKWFESFWADVSNWFDYNLGWRRWEIRYHTLRK